VHGHRGRLQRPALGIVALGDTLKSEAARTVAALRKAGRATVLVTGDNERATRRVAAETGIDEVHTGILPGAKPSSSESCRNGAAWRWSATASTMPWR
jgi:cation transport ATPase